MSRAVGSGPLDDPVGGKLSQGIEQNNRPFNDPHISWRGIGEKNSGFFIEESGWLIDSSVLCMLRLLLRQARKWHNRRWPLESISQPD